MKTLILCVRGCKFRPGPKPDAHRIVDLSPASFWNCQTPLRARPALMVYAGAAVSPPFGISSKLLCAIC